MPELPEVETVRRTLLQLTSGNRISRVIVSGKRVVDGTTRKRLGRMLSGKSIAGWLRRGKYLIGTGEGYLLLFHFGMSGNLIFFPQGHEPGKHTHLVIAFDDQSELHYCDPRTFGRVRLYPPSPLEGIPELANLGPEPLDASLSIQTLGNAFRSRKVPIKEILMNQRVIAGIGNIYASEILFQSSIHPKKAARDLTTPELQRLRSAIRRVLQEAIRAGGTSIISFRDAKGNKGRFQELLQVYGRATDGCPRCDATIQMELLGGRSTFYCPHCQQK